MNKQKNVPKLRFPEFSGEWGKDYLGNLALFFKGKGISKDDIDLNGDLACIRYGELYTHYSETIDKTISKTLVNIKDTFLSQKNDVIIPASGESAIDIARASCVLNEGIALGGDLNVLRTPLNGIFLAYYLNNAKKQDIARLSQGISIIHLYSAQLKLLGLSYPSLKEQQKIADFLSSVDKKIDALKQKQQLLQQYKKGMMQKLFSQQIHFKDDNGQGYPEWKNEKLSHTCKIVMGTSPDSKNYNSDNYGLPLIQGNADIVNRMSAPRVFTTQITKECFIGDILLTVRAPVGAVAKAFHHACIGRGICSISAVKNVEQEYIYQYLLFIEECWAKYSQGSTFDSINSSDLKELAIDIPSKQEQQKIANFLSAIDKKINLVTTQIEQTEQFKKGLLQQLFV